MRLLILDGHPDPAPGRFCHALSGACAEAAEAAGHTVDRHAISADPADPLRDRSAWEAPAPDWVAAAQAKIWAAEHLTIVYPLWLGGMPARLKGWLEHVMRPGWAFQGTGLSSGRLTGRSARLAVTMGMPGPVYRLYFGAHSVKSVDRNILRFVGIGPVRYTFLGQVEAHAATRDRHLATMRRLGAAGR